MVRKAISAVCISLLASILVVASGAGCGSCNQEDRRDGSDDGAATEGPTKRHGLTEAQAGEALVKIGDDTIVTVGELAERLGAQSPYLRARYDSPERRLEFLDTMVRFELLAHEALRRNLDDEPEVARVRKQLMIQAMMKTEFEDQIQLSDITDAEIRAYYEGHPDEFHKPEQVRAAAILIKSRSVAERTLADLRAHEDDAGHFREVAERVNEDEATSETFGDMRFFYRDGHRDNDNDVPVPGPVAEAAFGIDAIGHIAPTLVSTDAGFYIVKLTARRAPLQRTLEESERPIRNRLWREKRENAINEFVARLQREANVEENWDALQDVHIDAPEGESPTTEPPPGPAGSIVPALGPGSAPPRPRAPTKAP